MKKRKQRIYFDIYVIDNTIMPASTEKQANAAKLAGAVKSGNFPISKAGPAVKSMAKMPMKKLKHFMSKEGRELLTGEQKRRLLVGLKKLKEGYAGGGNTDITNADNLVSEESERTVVAKTFDTTAPFDPFVNQHRGIEMTPKEQQAIIGYDSVKPTQRDRFSVKFEKTDDFGTNDTTVVKKLKDGQQFCWTAFTTHSSAEELGQPEKPEAKPQEQPQKQKTQPQPSPQKPQAAPPQQAAQGSKPSTKQSTIAEQDAVPGGDKIRIIKSTTFLNDTDGANILGDFLRTLDL